MAIFGMIDDFYAKPASLLVRKLALRHALSFFLGAMYIMMTLRPRASLNLIIFAYSFS